MLVCNCKCRDDTDHAVGYDRDLDPEVWVRRLCLLCPVSKNSDGFYLGFIIFGNSGRVPRFFKSNNICAHGFQGI